MTLVIMMKRTASYPQIPSLDCPATLLVFMQKCGDVNPHPGPSTDTIDFPCLNGKGLHFLHSNIRSLPNKIDELRTIIHNRKAAVVGISESWLDHTFTDEEIRIDGFYTLRNDQNREGGGVCTFIRNDIAFRNRGDFNHESLEATWFELLMPKSKPIMIDIVYRSPDQNNFVENFEEVLSKIRLDIEVLILGDFNICVKKRTHSLYTVTQ